MLDLGLIGTGFLTWYCLVERGVQVWSVDGYERSNQVKI
jgi:hypothetical protein